MTEDSPVTLLRREYDAIARQLEGAPGNAEREAAKREIIGYFKRVDGYLGELTQLKDDIRQLVERYKQLTADTKQASAPEFTGSRPALHADHIGASTFIEKGWSLISLGDYAGAIQPSSDSACVSPGETQAESLLGWAQMLHEDYDDALGTFQKVLMKEPANSLARINIGYICLKKKIFGEAIEHLSKAIRLDNDKKATLYAHFYLGLVYLQREMYEDAQTFFQKTLKLGPNLIEAYYELGRAYWFGGEAAQAQQVWEEGFKANKFNPWQEMSGHPAGRASGGGAAAHLALLALLVQGPEAVQVGRVTAVAWPAQLTLAVALAEAADRAAPFPGVGPLPARPIRLLLAPDRARFDSLTRGRLPRLSEGAAFPEAGTVVLLAVGPPDHLAASLRHELAHLALRWRERRGQ